MPTNPFDEPEATDHPRVALPATWSIEITARLAAKSEPGVEIISPISDEFTYPLAYVGHETLGERADRYAANLGLADGIADNAYLQHAAAIGAGVVAADAPVRKVSGQPHPDDNIDGMLQRYYERIGLCLTIRQLEAGLRDAHNVPRHSTWRPSKPVAEHIIATASEPRYRRYHMFNGMVWVARSASEIPAEVALRSAQP